MHSEYLQGILIRHETSSNTQFRSSFLASGKIYDILLAHLSLTYLLHLAEL